MCCKLTRKKAMLVGFSEYDTTLMINALATQCPHIMIQERSWFILNGKESLAIRTVKAFDTTIALSHIERMIIKAETNSRIKVSIWKNLKLCIEKVKEHESNS